MNDIIDYNVTVELTGADEEAAAEVFYADGRFSPAVHGAPDRRVAVTLTVQQAAHLHPGDRIDRVVSLACLHVFKLGFEPYAVQVLPTDEFDRRAGTDSDEWVSVPAAAAALGISQQRVRQLLDEEKLLGRKVGRDWNVSAQSVRDRIAALAG